MFHPSSTKQTEETGNGERHFISKLPLSDLLPPARLPHPNLLKQHHKLGSKCSHARDYGRQFPFKSPQPLQTSNGAEMVHPSLSNHEVLSIAASQTPSAQEWEGDLPGLSKNLLIFFLLRTYLVLPEQCSYSNISFFGDAGMGNLRLQ